MTVGKVALLEGNGLVDTVDLQQGGPDQDNPCLRVSAVSCKIKIGS
jgi:hypothetical protein